MDNIDFQPLTGGDIMNETADRCHTSAKDTYSVQVSPDFDRLLSDPVSSKQKLIARTGTTHHGSSPVRPRKSTEGFVDRLDNG